MGLTFLGIGLIVVALEEHANSIGGVVVSLTAMLVIEWMR